jgi:hypothetical protein
MPLAQKDNLLIKQAHIGAMTLAQRKNVLVQRIIIGVVVLVSIKKSVKTVNLARIDNSKTI